MEKTARLEAISSRADGFGNRYWMLRFTDYATGKVVEGTISGGESNIRCIMLHWNSPDWDRSIEFETREIGIREWNRLAKGLPYAGCVPEELAAFIRNALDVGGNA